MDIVAMHRDDNSVFIELKRNRAPLGFDRRSTRWANGSRSEPAAGADQA
jgi:hypothetical protein